MTEHLTIASGTGRDTGRTPADRVPVDPAPAERTPVDPLFGRPCRRRRARFTAGLALAVVERRAARADGAMGHPGAEPA